MHSSSFTHGHLTLGALKLIPMHSPNLAVVHLHTAELALQLHTSTLELHFPTALLLKGGISISVGLLLLSKLSRGLLELLHVIYVQHATLCIQLVGVQGKANVPFLWCVFAAVPVGRQ